VIRGKIVLQCITNSLTLLRLQQGSVSNLSQWDLQMLHSERARASTPKHTHTLPRQRPAQTPSAKMKPSPPSHSSVAAPSWEDILRPAPTTAALLTTFGSEDSLLQLMEL